MDVVNLIRMRRNVERRERARRLRQFREQSRHYRRLRDASNPFEMPERTFIGKYRLTPQLVLRLCEELRPLMRAPQRGTAVPLEFKVKIIK